MTLNSMTHASQRTDTELKNAVTAELAWLANVDSTHIGVAVNHGAVTLSGEVESYPERLLAEEAALKVRGVTAIAEEITVRSSFQGTNDTDIAREANEALQRSVDIPGGSVSATVHDRAITLTGHLPWNYQREAAGRSVRYLKGVRTVHNEITVRPTVSAMGIKAAIGEALKRTAEAEGRHTTVTADAAGAVTLDGKVHSWTERQAAAQAAWFAPGVTSVTNNLVITS